MGFNPNLWVYIFDDECLCFFKRSHSLGVSVTWTRKKIFTITTLQKCKIIKKKRCCDASLSGVRSNFCLGMSKYKS